MRKSSSASLPSPDGVLPPTLADTCGRGGRLARHVAGIRTTTPALSSCGTSLKKLHGLIGRPAQRVEDLARIDHGLQPRTGLRRSLHGKKQRQQTILVCRAGIFAQSLTQRKMLGLGMRRQPRGVGGKKSERRISDLCGSRPD